MINKIHLGLELNVLWRSAWSRNSGIPIPRRLFHVTPTWQRTTCIFQWSLEREFMYFAGKLVYLIVCASNQLGFHFASENFSFSSRNLHQNSETWVQNSKHWTRKLRQKENNWWICNAFVLENVKLHCKISRQLSILTSEYAIFKIIYYLFLTTSNTWSIYGGTTEIALFFHFVHKLSNYHVVLSGFNIS